MVPNPAAFVICAGRCCAAHLGGGQINGTGLVNMVAVIIQELRGSLGGNQSDVVDQSAAGVARVDRGTGLDDAG
jgi:hypothetical protein